MNYIGIDPDVNKSGFAVWSKPKQKFLKIVALEFWQMIDEICQLDKENTTFILDSTFQSKKSNWHSQKSVGVAGMIGRKVGKNNQVAELLIQYFDRNGYQYKIVNPAGKAFTNSDKNFKFLTGYKARTNKDMREAAILVYGI